MRRRRKKREGEGGSPEMTEEPSEHVPDEEEVDAADAGELAALQEERDALEDKLRRALADIQNMRRRQVEEVRQAGQAATGRVAQEILPIMDSFEFALSAGGDRDSLLEGVRMVHSMLEDLLGRHGIEPVQALEQPFDPQFHEAVAVEARADVPPNTVVAVQQKGFRIGDRVLRPARVVVSQNTAGLRREDVESAEGPERGTEQDDAESPERSSEQGDAETERKTDGTEDSHD